MKTLILISMLVTSFLWSQDIPDLELTDINGDIQTLGQMTGKEFVLVDFWATWCAPCKIAMKDLSENYESFLDKDIQIIGVNIDGPRNLAKVKPYVKTRKIPYPVLYDTNMTLHELLGVTGIPTMIVFDSKWNIIYRKEGYISGELKTIERELSDIINQGR